MTLAVVELTSAGYGAVSVISARGPCAPELVARAFALGGLEVGRPRVARLVHAGSELDEALVCALAEDDVEIHVHGSPVVVRAVLAALRGRAPAAPGRTRERALALLASAASEAGARILLDQAEGAFERFLAALEKSPRPRELVQEVARGSRAARHAIEAPRVVLAGAVNAGKSTLFNVLVGSERALTSPIPGTTRDLVRARARVGRYVVEFVDTAGERDVGHDPAAEIERAGQQSARAERERADLVLWLVAGARTAAPRGSVLLATQADRFPAAHSPAVAALTDPVGTRAALAELVARALDLPADPWTPGSARAFDQLSRAALHALEEADSEAALRARAAELRARDSD